MVGKAVLLECLESKHIKSILVINRKTLDFNHPKLKEIIHKDLSDLNLIKGELNNFDACFHCMGVSSIGMNEKEFSHLTYSITKEIADTLYGLNPNIIFNYVSGTGTDSTEKGPKMWARVKGKTENHILKKGFKDSYMFRPGAIIPEKGIKSSTNWYQYLYVIMTPFFSLLKKSKKITTTTKLGQAMINSCFNPQDLKHLENNDINKLASM